ncbi:hypothetical protein KI387_041503, partial [Taxus chinensis]
MGNRLCSDAARPSKTVKIIRSDGGIERIKAEKVAEVMLGYPNHFVCKLSSLQAGHRVAALTAEEELERGNVYALLPMHKLRSVLSDSDMDFYHHKKKRMSSNSKILPVCNNGDDDVGEEKTLPKLKVSEEEIEAMKMRMGRGRNWKPT